MAPTVKCAAGEFRGATAAGADSWKGIRYALAPTGELRWRAPRASPPVVADALAFGPAAPQIANPAIKLGDGIRIDEDCLFLNVWRPADRTGESLPVMVWIHGGAYALGSGSQPLYDATSLAATHGIVVVTINYRLGALGFLDLTAFSSDETPFDGNLALRDILLALEWVRDNVAAFGGDPARVTVAGESAGGGLVTALLACPAANGLYSRAIIESSPASSIYGLARAEAIARRFLDRVDVTPDAVASLRDLAVDRIVQAGMAVYAEVPAAAPGTLAFAPVVDGDLLPEPPIDVIREGRGMPVPLLIGTNENEASLFKFMRSPLMPIAETEIMRMFTDLHAEQPNLELPPRERVLSAYADERPRARGLAVARDIAFRLPALWVAEGHSRVADTWLYRFDRATPIMRLLGIGATHAAELPYVWGNLGGRGNPAFRLGGRRVATMASARTQARWAAFIRGGRPEAPNAIEWPKYTDETRTTLVIDRVDKAVPDLDAAMRGAWGDETIAFR